MSSVWLRCKYRNDSKLPKRFSKGNLVKVISKTLSFNFHEIVWKKIVLKENII